MKTGRVIVTSPRLFAKSPFWSPEIDFAVGAPSWVSGPFWNHKIPNLDVWVAPDMSNDWMLSAQTHAAADDKPTTADYWT